ncbi:MAG: hypothetical protein Q8916_11160 [Bacteroidota bacterium]|nr:hypothetical protein [Bacteroidota bacterium]MDP4230949.1 hypothetical protein [Bacteroidota bacterium]MDP4236937.1 hypothetical protein [Bacteroidota bacterium]
MKNNIPATLSVALPQLQSKSLSTKITLAAAFMVAGLFFTFAGVSQAEVKFSKPVVLLRGTVHSEQTGRVHSVKVSIRSAENRDQEITSSVSNSVSGNYLVVLAPNTKYVVRLESRGVVTKEEMIQTPPVDENTIRMNKDFTVKTTSSKKDLGNLTK